MFNITDCEQSVCVKLLIRNIDEFQTTYLRPKNENIQVQISSLCLKFFMDLSDKNLLCLL